MRPLVLLANDDGYRSRGLRLLLEALRPTLDVVVCAPAAEQSAASHALTLHRPLRLVRRGPARFSVDGTPADCVYVALHATGRVLSRRPDLVVSGLNHGVNLGDDVFYSGTVAAAREGALKGVPALAVSAAPGADLESAARESARLATALAAARLSRPALLNVNFPATAPPWTLSATRLGTRRYEESIDFRRDPRGREYLWIGGTGVVHAPLPGSDTEAFDRGEVGVTPLVLDLWARDDCFVVEELLATLASA